MFDESGDDLNIVGQISPKWKFVATLLGLSQAEIDVMSKKFVSNSELASYHMICKWIDQRHFVTWDHLLKALRKADYLVLAHEVELALERKQECNI